MADAKKWLLENMSRYGENERHQFLRDCADSTGAADRTVRHHYKTLFLPVQNNRNTDILENNNPLFSDIKPGTSVDDKEEGTNTTVAEDNDDLVKYGVKLAKRAQKLQDTNRIERKSFREHARIDNAVSEFSKEIRNLLDKYELHDGGSIDFEDSPGKVGVIQISDLHLNELISIAGNSYDFSIASRRLKKLACKAVKYLNAFDINNVLLAFTGDLMNSDRRLDELLSQASNRAKAAFLAFDLLQQFVCEIAGHFKISVLCVTGNESRMNKEMGFTDIMVSDNYDFTIFSMLEYLFKDSDVDFIQGDHSEQVINIAGMNVLFTHGTGIKTKCEESVSRIMGRYAAKGIKLSYVVFGHLHSARIGDTYARSSSLCGANAYSERGLNLTSRASQNVYILGENGDIDGIKIDLQNTEDQGYDISETLEAYNAKSADKIKNRETIMRITI